MSVIHDISISWNELFPWIPWFTEVMTKYEAPFFYAWTVFSLVFMAAVLLLVFLKREFQFFPVPKVYKYSYKWDSKTVALFGLLTAVVVVINRVGGLITIIPGIMGFGVFYYALMFTFPIIFGWPGVWSAAIGEILGHLIGGGSNPGLFYCAFAYDFFLGWWAWKAIDGRTSLRNLKSWGLVIGTYLAYAFFQSFGWGTVYIHLGIMPRSMLMPRSAFNIIWYYFFIWIYPPLIFLFDGIGRRYGLHFKTIQPDPYERL